MDTFNMQSNATVSASTNISSIAVVGSNVLLNNEIVKKSIQYKFSTDLGNSNAINGKMARLVVNCFVKEGNIDTVMADTNISFTLSDGSHSHAYEAKKLKIFNDLFVATADVTLKIS